MVMTGNLQNHLIRTLLILLNHAMFTDAKLAVPTCFFFVYLFLHLNLTLAAWIEYIVVAVTTHD